jgi:hypothetical protein
MKTGRRQGNLTELLRRAATELTEFFGVRQENSLEETGFLASPLILSCLHVFLLKNDDFKRALPFLPDLFVFSAFFTGVRRTGS